MNVLKKILLLGILPVFFCKSYGQSESLDAANRFDTLFIPHKYVNIVKTNPFIPLWGTIPFTAEYRIVYEGVIAKNQTVLMSFSYLGKSPFIAVMENQFPANGNISPSFLIKGFRLQAAHRIYLAKLNENMGYYPYAPEGFYIGPHISYATANFGEKSTFAYNYITFNQFNFVLMTGLQTFIDQFAIDVFFGLGYKKNTVSEWRNSQIIYHDPAEIMGNFYASPVKIYLGFNVGIGFN